MSNSSLQRYDNNGLELVIDQATGESFATVSGYARMVDKDKSTISRRLQGVALANMKTAEITTAGGLQGVALISESLICEWLPKDNPAMATQMMRLGVRVFLHGLAGFEVKSSAIVAERPKLPAYVEAVEISRAINEIADNLGDNPRLAQFLIDHAISEIMPSNVSLAGDRLMGVVEIAEKLGYQPKPTIRGQLGKFVKSQCEDLASYEERLVNGTFRKVACYPENHERVIKAIGAFFA